MEVAPASPFIGTAGTSGAHWYSGSQWGPVKKVEAPGPTNARGCLLYYFGRGGSGGGSSSSTMTSADKAAAELARRDRRNGARRAAFANSDVALD